ncbi:alkyl hydroperoxide reductase [Sphingobacteriaceae bacterium]|nr:alkyl hydroperoxide reductase [Sphingobacteriaceae bacterium]
MVKKGEVMAREEHTIGSTELEPRLKKIRNFSVITKRKADMDIKEGHIQFLRKINAVDNVLKVGEVAPVFSLVNQSGEMISSAEFLKNGPLVISFQRGSWCPYCVEEVDILNNIYPQITAARSDLLVISPQNQLGHPRVKFNMLLDQDNALGKKFGLVYELPQYLQKLYSLKFGNDIAKMNGTNVWELPMPARFIIGQDGIILSAQVDPDYRFRPEPLETVNFLKSIKE